MLPIVRDLRLFGPVWGLCALAFAGQDPAPGDSAGIAPIGLIRGDLIEAATGPAGMLAIRTSDLRVYRFEFDQRTYVERENQYISTRGLKVGDFVEIVSGNGPKPSIRYARMVHVLDRRGTRQLAPAPVRLRPLRSPTESFAPRGTLTFSGTVVNLSPESFLLRTRLDGERVILRREDTKYLEGGAQVESGKLVPNTRVFVRAGRNGDEEIEAYQVVWGEILAPMRRH